MAYSTYKTVILIDKTSELTRHDRPYYVQINRYETLRDKPHISHHQISEKRLLDFIKFLHQNYYNVDSRYGLYGHWYAVRYDYGEW